jgi:hypothetical protein
LNVPYHLQQRPRVGFVDLETGRTTPSLWPLLERGYWRQCRPEFYQQHFVGNALRATLEETFFPRHAAIRPGRRWVVGTRCVEHTPFQQTSARVTLSDFIHVVADYFNRLGGRRIAVQVSGGVDSSLIIGLMRFLNIPHFLVGMVSSRYEFRTERAIQEHLLSRNGSGELVDYECHLPLSDLSRAPRSTYPDVASLAHSANYAMARVCEENGVDLLLSGAGGDVLLGGDMRAGSPPCHPHFFQEPWSQEFVYASAGVSYHSFFSDPHVAGCLCSLRAGHSEDTSKFWARQFFRNFLPDRIVDTLYKTDFWGLYISGLNSSLPEIRRLHAAALDATGNAFFLPAKLEHLLTHDLMSCDQSLYQHLEARISAAAWFATISSMPSSTSTP